MESVLRSEVKGAQARSSTASTCTAPARPARIAEGDLKRAERRLGQVGTAGLSPWSSRSAIGHLPEASRRSCTEAARVSYH